MTRLPAVLAFGAAHLAFGAGLLVAAGLLLRLPPQPTALVVAVLAGTAVALLVAAAVLHLRARR